MRLVRYRDGDHASRVAVAGEPGRLYTPMVWIDSPVRLARVENAEAARYSVELNGQTVRKAARSMLKAGKRLGITGGAKALLREAARR